MNTENLCIGETFILVKEEDKIIEKRIGYQALMYIEEFHSYLSVGSHREYYIELSNQPIGEAYIKDGSIVNYLSFASPTYDKNEIINNLKNKIEELATLRKKQKFSQEKTIKNKISYQNRWMHNFELVCAYQQHYHNLCIPFRFVTINGVDFDENGTYLGAWLNNQKNYYQNGKLSKERIELLKSIGLQFEKNPEEPHRRTILNRANWEKKWYETYKMVCNYYQHYHNLCIPYDFKTKDGINYDEDGIYLNIWIHNQKTKCKKKELSEDKVQLLNELGIFFLNRIETNKNKWEKFYNLCALYYEYHGNLKLSNNFKTKNGIDYDENGFNIESWLRRQLVLYNKGLLNNEKKKLLEQIGVKFDICAAEESWNEKYSLAKKYYDHYGNLEIPYLFKTKDGINYSEDGVSLGQWLSNVKNSYKGLGAYHLNAERIKQMELIHVTWYDNGHMAKLVNKTIEENNYKKINKELTNILYSTLNEYDDDETLPNKEELEKKYLRKLS